MIATAALTEFLSCAVYTYQSATEAVNTAGGRERIPEGTQAMMRDVDFSRVNLHYLICARDLARTSPGRAEVLLGAPETIGQVLAELDAETLAAVMEIKAPLLVLRQESWWWTRLFTALKAGQRDEVQSILAQAGLFVANG